MTPPRLRTVGSGLGLAVWLVTPVYAAAAPPARSGPPLTLEQFVDERPAQDQAMVDAHIAKMRRLLQVTADDDPQKPDFWFRLGELYAEKLRTFAAQARALEPKLAATPPAERPALEAQRRAYESARQKWLLEAVKAYIAATKYRTYERMDAVLYKLIQLLASVGKDDQAREFFLRLQRDYPKSSHLPAATIALADAACGAGHLDDAVGLYERVEQLPGARLGDYATYAKGWCYLELGRTQEALESFVTVVMDSKPSLLRREAMRDSSGPTPGRAARNGPGTSSPRSTRGRALDDEEPRRAATRPRASPTTRPARPTWPGPTA